MCLFPAHTWKSIGLYLWMQSTQVSPTWSFSGRTDFFVQICKAKTSQVSFSPVALMHRRDKRTSGCANGLTCINHPSFSLLSQSPRSPWFVGRKRLWIQRKEAHANHFRTDHWQDRLSLTWRPQVSTFLSLIFSVCVPVLLLMAIF